MRKLPYNRRRFLQTGSIALAGATGLSHSVAADSMSSDRETWSFDTGDRVRSSPTVVDGTVFVGSHEGKVYALNAANGQERWLFETDRGAAAVSSPTVVDGTVFVGSHDNKMYALDADDGQERWSFNTRSIITTSPTVADGTVFVGNFDNKLDALDTDDGTELWSRKTNGIIRSSPTVVDGTVFVGSGDENVYALDAENGSEHWSFETNGSVNSSPTVVDGTVYVGSIDEKVYALDADDGSERWSFNTDGWVTSSPTVVDGTVFVGSRDEKVYALNVDDGSERWSFKTGERVRSSPTVADGTVFIGSLDDNVYALDSADGGELWSFETGNMIWSSPTVVDGTVFVGSHDGNVYALDGGVARSSEGSRVRLGTLGHHNRWADDQGDDTIVSATFEYSPDEPESGDTIDLDASESTVDNGSIETFEWDLTDDESIDETGETTTTEFDAGDHQVSLTVTATDGTTDIQTSPISVDSNVEIDASFEYSPAEPEAGDTVEFDASDSSIENGTIETFEWDLTDDGSTDDAGETSTTEFDAGDHQVTLTVTATDGTTDTEMISISVDPNVELDAAFEFRPQEPTNEEAVTLDASETTTRGVDVEKYEWDLTGDGSTDATGKRIQHIFEVSVHRVELTVTNDRGDQDSTHEIVDVSSASSEENSDTDDETPGFGIGEAITGLGGASYILHRQLGSSSENQK